jgi:ATP-binding cassette, subfamily G (WHITE), member 2, SNQ2
MVYPIGFGAGSAGLNGTGFDLLVVFFVEMFGVTLGQAIAAISPGVGVCDVILHVAFCSLAPYRLLR